jgi:hypothetical protein
MENMLFVAYDGDEIGNQVGRSVLRDDVEGLSGFSASIREGHEMICQWAESVGGQFISGGGDEGIFQIPAEAIGQLEEVRAKYHELVGATATFGVGSKMSEAGKALIYGKLNGKDQTVRYDRGLEDHLKEVHDKAAAGGGSEQEQKYEDAYLDDAVGEGSDEVDADSDQGDDLPFEGETEEELGDEQSGDPEEDDLGEALEDNGAEFGDEPEAELPEGSDVEFGDEPEAELPEEGEPDQDEFATADDELEDIQDDSGSEADAANAELDESRDNDEPQQYYGVQMGVDSGREHVDAGEAEEAAASVGEDELEQLVEEGEDAQNYGPEEEEDELANAIMAYDEDGFEDEMPEGEQEDFPAEEGDPSQGLEDDSSTEELGEDTADQMEGEGAEENLNDLLQDESELPEADGQFDADSLEGMDEGGREDLKGRILTVLQDFIQHRDHILSLQQENPELFQSQMAMLQNMVDMAHALGLDEGGDTEMGEQLEEFGKSEIIAEAKRRIEKAFAKSEDMNKARVDEGKDMIDRAQARSERNNRSLYHGHRNSEGVPLRSIRGKTSREDNVADGAPGRHGESIQGTPVRNISGVHRSPGAFTEGKDYGETRSMHVRHQASKIKPNLPKSEDMNKSRADEGKDVTQKIAARANRNDRKVKFNKVGLGTEGTPKEAVAGVHREAGAYGNPYGAPTAKRASTSEHIRIMDHNIHNKPSLPKSEAMAKARVDEGKSDKQKAADRSERNYRGLHPSSSVKNADGTEMNNRGGAGTKRRQDVSEKRAPGRPGEKVVGASRGQKGVHNFGGAFAGDFNGVSHSRHHEVMSGMKGIKPDLPKSEAMSKARVDEGKSPEEKAKARSERNNRTAGGILKKPDGTKLPKKLYDERTKEINRGSPGRHGEKVYGQYPSQSKHSKHFHGLRSSQGNDNQIGVHPGGGKLGWIPPKATKQSATEVLEESRTMPKPNLPKSEPEGN